VTEPDPFAQVAALPEVAAAVLSARAAVDRLLGHRVLRRRSAEVSAESALRGACASAALDGCVVALEEVRAGAVDEPIVQGALRASAEVGVLAETWRQAPRQVLARLHALAAADLVDAALLGRPRTFDQEVRDAPGPLSASWSTPTPGPPPRSTHDPDTGSTHGLAFGPASGSVHGPTSESAPVRDPRAPLPHAPLPDEVSARLNALMDLLMAGTEAPALVVGAIVHGELLALRPFGRGDGIVARTAQRVTLVARGLDPKSLVAPEVGHAELADVYEEALRGYAAGTPAGVAGWVRHCADAVSVAARDSLAFCEALRRG
jgi:hypothetical protein